MSRALLDENPELRRRLGREYVCVHAGTDNLQWAESAAARWFKRMADRILHEYGLEALFEKYQTYQGFYVCSPDGTPFAMALSWEADELTRVLDAGVEGMRARKPTPIEIADDDLTEADPPQADPSVSVVRVYCRCTPLPEEAHPVNRSVGRDTMWVFPEEVTELAASASRVGETVPLPATLVARLVRYQLLDNVRGMADPFGAEHVRKAKVAATLVRAEGDERAFSLRGEFAMEKDFAGDENYKGKLGVEGSLVGEIVIDAGSERVLRFRVLAEGEAWGANSNTWGQLPGRYPLVIAMMEAGDPLSRTRIPAWAGMVECTPDDRACDDYRAPSLCASGSE